MTRLPRWWPTALAVFCLATLAAWAFVPRAPADPQAQIAEARRLLAERFAGWRSRAERAAERIAAVANDGVLSRAGRFERAARIAADERVDGVAVVDWEHEASFWAGRTFDANPRLDFYAVAKGFEMVDILDRPARRVLFAARPAGEEIAVAFLAFDERFPGGPDLATEVAALTGLHRIRLRYGGHLVAFGEADEEDRPRAAGPVDGLVHATLLGRTPAELEEDRLAARNVRLRGLAFAAACGLVLVLWRLARERLPTGSLLRPLVLVTGLLGLRWALAELLLPSVDLFAPRGLWTGAGDTLLTAFTLLLATIVVARTARRRRGRRTTALLAAAGIAACAFLPRAYAALVTELVAREDGVQLFDPLQILPDLPAALLLAALGFLTATLFLVARAAHLWARQLSRWLAPLPFLAITAGFLPWQGPWIAAGAGLAALSLGRGGSRPERAATLTFLAAVVSFPILYDAQQDHFLREVAARTRQLVSSGQAEEVRDRLEGAVARATHFDEGVDLEVAEQIARGGEREHLAFLLWAAARWDADLPVAVQVWDLDGRLLSAFDFDSPPADWLPAPPRAARSPELLFGLGPGQDIRYLTTDFVLRTREEQPVGVARFAVPDRWDMLLSPLRAPLFSEPLDLLVRSASPPVLLAELLPNGQPRRTSSGTTADLDPPGRMLQRDAHRDGYATGRIEYRGEPADLVLVAANYSLAALVLPVDLLRQGGFAFAKVLLTDAALCLGYVFLLLLLTRRRGTLLFRHRIVVFLVLLSVPPVLLLAAYNRKAARDAHERTVAERLRRPLDLAQTLLAAETTEIDDAWCTKFAATHRMDLNVYRGQKLLATSRAGIWDTGLLGRRLDARPYRKLEIEERDDYTGEEYLTRAEPLRAAYRRVRGGWSDEPVIVSAPALEDRREVERRGAQSNALLLASYLLTATLTVFVALLLARTLTQPVRRLREAAGRVAAGELDVALPEKRRDEFGDLERAFNRMTIGLREAQDLRVRAEKAAAWREMARQIAHEIKNPLTPIKLTIQNLVAAYRERPAEFGEDFEAGAKLILDQIDALHRIAGEFSAYARFPSRQPEALDLNELLADVEQFYTAAGGSTVVLEAPPQPLVVTADRDELRRALINLVTNSRQAGARTVTLRATPVGEQARIDVVDDGSGVASDALERIWDPSFTTKSAGTGLGMPIVKRVVDDHGGRIEIDSAPGRGTRVTIHLPIRSA